MTTRAEADWAFEVRIWGSAYTGDVLEQAATAAESQAHPHWGWDRRAGDLLQESLDLGDGRGPQAPPHWWALPCVVRRLAEA